MKRFLRVVAFIAIVLAIGAVNSRLSGGTTLADVGSIGVALGLAIALVQKWRRRHSRLAVTSSNHANA